MSTITKYATTLEAIQDVRFGTNDWSNLENGVGNTNVSTSSTYTNNFTPKQLYAHDFGVELPEQCRIENIKFEVKIRGSVKETRVPIAFYELLNIGKHTDVDYGQGVYSDQPKINISDSFNTITYEMGKDDAQTFNATKSNIESDRFGVLLKFDSSKYTGGVSIEWIRVIIKYAEPEYICEIRGHVTPNDWEAQYLYKHKPLEEFNVLFYVHNPITFVSNPKSVKIEIPLGLRITRFETSQGATFDENTRMLHLDWSRAGSPYVNIYFVGTTFGLKKFSIRGDSKIGVATRYTYIEKTLLREMDDEQVVITSTDVRKGAYSDFYIGIRALSLDSTAGYNFYLKGSDPAELNNDRFVSFELDESRTSAGVSVNYYLDSYVEFNVPPEREVDIYFTVRFLPDFVGDEKFLVEPDDTGYEYYYDYTSLEPYTYRIDVNYDDNKDIVFTNSRMVSTINTGAYVYPMAVSEFDNPLVMDKSTLRLTKFNDIDYIGCVALEQTHFNPKSTYKDTLLNTSYKNKTYMGKKGVLDETITLNVRLHPRDVTTMQGLVAMDKPVPINANHLCFEGDALNHRGWVELYGITAEETNPHWYKCTLSVKYITHNLNTRFSINKGSNVTDYFLPDLMNSVCEYGDDLTEYFYIETNGGYYYSKDVEDYHLRNMFILANSNKFKITQNELLGLKSQVNFNWYSTRNYEAQDNNISRIVRLIDDQTGNAVMEYEWYDVDYSRTSEYTCRVICRILHKGAYKTILNRTLVLNRDVEYDGDEFDENSLFGSELILKLIGDNLSIQDCGISGKELLIEDIDLQNGLYYFETEFVNNNIDFDAPNIGVWADISVSTLEYSPDFAGYYKNLLISPFPVPGKTILFTRESEEGSIFYIRGDDTECSYMVNPYFQYHCGVDLQTRDGISIFNLDNNYQVVYITNGLVKLGINRYNGRMTLSKYDKQSRTYITVSRLQLTKYDDININSFSDDKIELQVSDTVITMWRGHPYIYFEHPNEDILLMDKLVKVYGNGVGNASADIPSYYSIIDSTNLLPTCVASERKIDPKCFTVTEEEVDDPATDVYIRLMDNQGMAAESLIIADCQYEYDGMKFIIDGIINDGIPPSSDDTLSFTHKINYKFEYAGTHTAKAVYWKGGNYYYSPTIEFNIEDNTYRIIPTFPDSMYYRQHGFTGELTYAGSPVENETVTIYVNGLSYTRVTDSEGKFSLKNRLPAGYYPVDMMYSEGGEVLARTRKDTNIMKGYANIDLVSSDYIADPTQPKRTVTRGGYVQVNLTNNLDPTDDDVTIDETYITGKQIVISVNGRDYIRTTDNEGKAKLNINLLTGSYDIKVSFPGSMEYNGNVKNFEIRVIE